MYNLNTKMCWNQKLFNIKLDLKFENYDFIVDQILKLKTLSHLVCTSAYIPPVALIYFSIQSNSAACLCFWSRGCRPLPAFKASKLLTLTSPLQGMVLPICCLFSLYFFPFGTQHKTRWPTLIYLGFSFLFFHLQVSS